MFETVFALMSAWSSLLYLGAGAMISGIGLLILAYAFYVRATERSYAGQIVSVKTQNPDSKMYWPVVAYTTADGARHESLTNSSSSLISGSIPGTRITVFADPNDPSHLMLARDWWILFALGVVFAGVGAPFIAVGLSGLHFNMPTLLVALGLSAYFGTRLYRTVHPFLHARKVGDWQAAKAAFAARVKQQPNLQPLSDAQISLAVAEQNRNSKYALPIFAVVGAAAMIGGGTWFQHEREFLRTALHTEGVVLHNEESDDSDGKPSYHAVVAFTDRGGNRIVYTDSLGSSPPMYSTGDKVTVLYSPNNSSSATTDRGIWNWLVPLLIVATGTLIFTLCTRALFSRANMKPATV